MRELAEHDFLFPGEHAGTLRFKHGVTRDVIYASVGLLAAPGAAPAHRRSADAARAPRAAKRTPRRWPCTLAPVATRRWRRTTPNLPATERWPLRRSTVPGRTTAPRWLRSSAVSWHGERRAALGGHRAAPGHGVHVRSRAQPDRRWPNAPWHWPNATATRRASRGRGTGWAASTTRWASRARPSRTANVRCWRPSRPATNRWRCRSMASLGEAHTAAGQYARATALLDRAIDIKRSHRSGRHTNVGLAYSLVCRGVRAGRSRPVRRGRRVFRPGAGLRRRPDASDRRQHPGLARRGAAVAGPLGRRARAAPSRPASPSDAQPVAVVDRARHRRLRATGCSSARPEAMRQHRRRHGLAVAARQRTVPLAQPRLAGRGPASRWAARPRRNGMPRWPCSEAAAAIASAWRWPVARWRARRRQLAARRGTTPTGLRLPRGARPRFGARARRDATRRGRTRGRRRRGRARAKLIDQAAAAFDTMAMDWHLDASAAAARAALISGGAGVGFGVSISSTGEPVARSVPASSSTAAIASITPTPIFEPGRRAGPSGPIPWRSSRRRTAARRVAAGAALRDPGSRWPRPSPARPAAPSASGAPFTTGRRHTIGGTGSLAASCRASAARSTARAAAQRRVAGLDPLRPDPAAGTRDVSLFDPVPHHGRGNCRARWARSRATGRRASRSSRSAP